MFLRFLQATVAMTLSELRHSMTGKKMSAAAVLSCFPPLIMFILMRTDDDFVSQSPELVLTILMWMVGLLSLLLWLPSNVASELEGQTWIFATSRPFGRATLLLGKYFSAVAWTLMIEALAYTGAVVVCMQHYDLSAHAPGLIPIIVLAAFAYGAVFSLLGSLALKKAMGFAVGYCLVSEILIATVPALVQKFTVRSHLQALWLHWVSDFETLQLGELERVLQTPDPLPIWGNVVALIAIAVLVMVGTVGIANFRQYLTQAEA